MRRPEGKFGSRRHPLCPECRYDLIATVAAGRTTCPECGYEFEAWELRGEKHAGEWTPLVGLRRAVISLAIRSLIILPLWAGLVWGLTPLLLMFPLGIRVFGGIAILLAIPGCLIGHVLASGLADRAGFQSMLLGFLAAVFAVTTIISGIMIAQIANPLPGWQGGFTAIATSLFAVGWIIRATLLDD
jgi:hypothetical protein